MLYPHLINSHDTTEKKTPRFAKTVAIALGIADQLQLPAIQVFGPTLAMLLGKDHGFVSIACVKKGHKGPSNCDLSMCSNHLKPIHYPIFFRCKNSPIPVVFHGSPSASSPSDPKLQDLSHWTAPIIGTTIKVIAVVISSYIQAVISAFYSGIRGGRLFGEAFGDPVGGTGGCWGKKRGNLMVR